MPRSTVLVLVALIATLIIEHQVKEGHVVKASAGVNFTHHSRVDPIPEKRFSITNFIKNNSTDRPLSVRWDEAGILCTGSLQLGPGMIDTGNTGYVTETPYLRRNSQIKYGLALQYNAYADIYVDPQTQKAKNEVRTSTYERLQGDKTLFKITISAYKNDDRSATIDISIQGNLSIVLPDEIGRSVVSINNAARWRVSYKGGLRGNNRDEGRSFYARMTG